MEWASLIIASFHAGSESERVVCTCHPERGRIPVTVKHRLITGQFYGPIALRPLEWELVNTKAFQRLRHIRQLGLVNLVFPGAEHSRFTHSIGTLAVMARMIDQLLLTHADDARFCEQLRHEEPSLRAAALLHDIGHFPLSHLFEVVYQHRRELEDGKRDLKISARRPKRDYLHEAAELLSTRHEKDYNHEVVGAEVVKKRREISEIVDRLDKDAHPASNEVDQSAANGARLTPKGRRGPAAKVAALIRGERATVTSNYVFSNLMHSELDADRLDYLQRDCSETGMVYGRVDSAYICSLLVAAGAEEAKTRSRPDPPLVLAMARKGVRAADHYVLARFHFYTQLIHHKTVCAFNSLATALILHMIDNGELKPLDSYQDVRKRCRSDDFLRFHDILFWEGVQRHLQDKDSPGIWARSLYYRYPPRLVENPPDDFSVRASGTAAEERRRSILENVCKASGLSAEEVFMVETEDALPEHSRDFKDNIEAVRVVTDQGLARCLVERKDSLLQRLHAESLYRSWVFRIHPKAFRAERRRTRPMVPTAPLGIDDDGPVEALGKDEVAATKDDKVGRPE